MNTEQLHKPWSVSAEELNEEIVYISKFPEFQIKPGGSAQEYALAMPKIAYWRIIRQKVVFMFIITELIFGIVALAGWFNFLEVDGSNMSKIIFFTALIYSLFWGFVHLVYKYHLRKI